MDASSANEVLARKVRLLSTELGMVKFEAFWVRLGGGRTGPGGGHSARAAGMNKGRITMGVASILKGTIL